MQITNLNKANIVSSGSNLLGIHLQGLFGDTILASCAFDYILKTYPNYKWVLLHRYDNLTRAPKILDLLQTHIDNNTIIDYLYMDKGSAAPTKEEYTYLKRCGSNTLINLYAYQIVPPIELTAPNLGINLDRPRNKDKAIICRYSGWHSHFPGRNRPINEWGIIEKALLNKGYKEIYLTGFDDPYPNNNNLIDVRGLGVYETLELSADADIVITPITFLYVWSQFICPTIVLSTPDHMDQFNLWKRTPNLLTVSIDGEHINTVTRLINEN